MNQVVEQIKIAARDIPKVKIPTRHYLLEGMYLRQTCIPRGTLFVGRVHVKPNYFIVAKGSTGIYDESGKIVELKAGMVFMTSPGTERIGVTYEDTVFVTVHRTDKTELSDIEAEVVEYDSANLYGLGNTPLVQLLKESV
jgi:Xaa-Pro aminopeptidase